jgi:hypothetical protein
VSVSPAARMPRRLTSSKTVVFLRSVLCPTSTHHRHGVRFLPAKGIVHLRPMRAAQRLITAALINSSGASVLAAITS